MLTDFRRSTNSLIAIDKASDLAALEKALLEAAAGRGGQVRWGRRVQGV